MNFSKMDALLEDFTAWRIPGCAVVVTLDGKQVYTGASGYANVSARKPMTRHHYLYMYSASKPVTCALALSLWERGKFILTDPIEKYIPEWANMKVIEKTEDGKEILADAHRSITIGDLFSMTSGLDYNNNRPHIANAIKTTYPKCPTVDIIKALGEDPLIFHPGEKWFYGLSHDVLGALIEIISDMSLKEYAKKAIFDPLGMYKTWYGPFTAPRDLANQYEWDDSMGKYVKTDNTNYYAFGEEYYSGGAGIVSTVDDMAKFTAAMSLRGTSADGIQILAPSTVDLMKTARLSEKQRESFNWNALIGYSYGLGVRTLVDKAEAGSPSSLGEFGWTGAAGAYMLIDTDKKLSMFYSHHMLNNQEEYTTPRLRNVLYSCID